jgi:hypothetical protein
MRLLSELKNKIYQNSISGHHPEIIEHIFYSELFFPSQTHRPLTLNCNAFGCLNYNISSPLLSLTLERP